MPLPQLAVLVVALIGAVYDLRTRRIPNVLTFGAAAGAFGFHLAEGGLSGLGHSAGGWALGLALFFPFFALRGIGGGDVKLLAALGAWLGPAPTLWLAFWTAMAGGVLAIAVALARGYFTQAFANVWGLLGYWRVMGIKPHPVMTLESAAGAPRLPYALPIAAGVVITLWFT